MLTKRFWISTASGKPLVNHSNNEFMKMQETIHAVHSYDFHFYHAREALSHAPFLHCCRCCYYYVVCAFFLSFRNYLLFVSFMKCLACMTSLNYAFVVYVQWMMSAQHRHSNREWKRVNETEWDRERVGKAHTNLQHVIVCVIQFEWYFWSSSI